MSADEHRQHEKYDELIARCQGLAPILTAVAHPCDDSSLSGAIDAAEAGIIQPYLVGPTAKIRAVAEKLKLNLGRCELVDVPHNHAAAEKAVELVRLGKAELLMKGSLHTGELMAEVVRKDTGLRTERRISHVFIMDVTTYPKPLFITDAAVNIFPTLDDKVDIVKNAIALAQALEIKKPKVAILSAVETVNSKIPSTIDAAALCKMADRGQITGAVLDGPLARSRGRQYARQRADFPCQCRRRRNRFGSSLPDHSDEPRRQRPRAHGERCCRGALRPRAAGGHCRDRVTAMREPMLVVNAGSSSIKFSVFETSADRSLVAGAHGQVEGIGTSPHLEVSDPHGTKLADAPVAGAGHTGAIAAIHDWFAAHVGSDAGFDGVGHRVVDGGSTYSQPVLIDSKVMTELEALIPLAPLHQPHHIAAIRAISAIYREVPQIACFDTAFHRSQPALAQEFAIPREPTAKGIRRYGFHGLSYEYIVSVLPEVMPDCAQGDGGPPAAGVRPADWDAATRGCFD